MRRANYSLGEILYNAKCLAETKLRFPGARLIRTPITVRGRKYIDFGTSLTTGRNCQLEVTGTHADRCLRFGRNVNIGHNVKIQCAESVSIGDNVLIGSRVTVIDHSHGGYSGETQDSPDTPPNERELVSAPVVIGDNVWVGDGAVIQQGVSIGRGSVIAANSVVTGPVPEEVIAGGVPARILKRYDPLTRRWERV